MGYETRILYLWNAFIYQKAQRRSDDLGVLSNLTQFMNIVNTLFAKCFVTKTPKLFSSYISLFTPPPKARARTYTRARARLSPPHPDLYEGNEDTVHKFKTNFSISQENTLPILIKAILWSLWHLGAVFTGRTWQSMIRSSTTINVNNTQTLSMTRYRCVSRFPRSESRRSNSKRFTQIKESWVSFQLSLLYSVNAYIDLQDIPKRIVYLLNTKIQHADLYLHDFIFRAFATPAILTKP